MYSSNFRASLQRRTTRAKHSKNVYLAIAYWACFKVWRNHTNNVTFVISHLFYFLLVSISSEVSVGIARSARVPKVWRSWQAEVRPRVVIDVIERAQNDSRSPGSFLVSEKNSKNSYVTIGHMPLHPEIICIKSSDQFLLDVYVVRTSLRFQLDPRLSCVINMGKFRWWTAESCYIAWAGFLLMTTHWRDVEVQEAPLVPKLAEKGRRTLTDVLIAWRGLEWIWSRS